MTSPIRSPRPHRPDGVQPVPTPDRLTGSELTVQLDDEEPRFSLSITQVLASMTAAVIAALIGSTLGVAGTLTGAALASVVSVVGGAIFGHSILMTRRRVKQAVLQVRGVDGQSGRTTWLPDPADPSDDPTVLIPAVTRYDLDRAVTRLDLDRAARTGPEQHEPGRPKPTRRRAPTRVLVGVAAFVAILVGSLAAVTVVEAVKGSPLSGGTSGGLSVLGGNGGQATDPAQVPAATKTEESTASTTVTATVTSTQTKSPSTQSTTTAPPSPSPTSSESASTSASSSAVPSTSAPSAAAGTAERSAAATASSAGTTR